MNIELEHVVITLETAKEIEEFLDILACVGRDTGVGREKSMINILLAYFYNGEQV